MKSLKVKSFLIFFSFLIISGYADSGFSQDSKNVLVSPLTPVIQFSNAEFKNNVNHDISVSGCKNGIDTFLFSVGPFEIFKVEVKDYDSLKFHSEWDIDESNTYEVKYFIKVLENKKFEYTPVPLFKLTGLEMIVDNVSLKNMIGKKLYEVTINDDVNSGAIKVAALETSAPYIDIIKIDTVTYQIKLKQKDEFIRDLTDVQIKSWSRGEELSFPIGIKLYDTIVPDDEQIYQLFLVKKKKPKKTSG